VANTCNPSGNDASACLDISFGTQQDVFTILGYWTQNDGADWAYINNDDGGAGIMYTLTGDSTCEDNSGQMAPWLTNVQFPCASEVSVTTAAISGCTVTFSWPTPLSCKPTGPSTPPPGHDKDGGISGGTVAAIIITLLLVFGLVGALLWWLNKNGKLERVKAAFGGSGAHERLLDNGGQLQV
jgi:hypothetical protein